MHQEFKSENWMGGRREGGAKFKATVTIYFDYVWVLFFLIKYFLFQLSLWPYSCLLCFVFWVLLYIVLCVLQPRTRARCLLQEKS